jgi:hypothetical protein
MARAARPCAGGRDQGSTVLVTGVDSRGSTRRHAHPPPQPPHEMRNAPGCAGECEREQDRQRDPIECDTRDSPRVENRRHASAGDQTQHKQGEGFGCCADGTLPVIQRRMPNARVDRFTTEVVMLERRGLDAIVGVVDRAHALAGGVRLRRAGRPPVRVIAARQFAIAMPDRAWGCLQLDIQRAIGGDQLVEYDVGGRHARSPPGRTAGTRELAGEDA